MTDAQMIRDMLDTLAASYAVMGSHVQAVEALAVRLCEQNAVSLDGLPAKEWLKQQRVAALEKSLIGLENQNPAVAARVQVLLDSLKRRGG